MLIYTSTKYKPKRKSKKAKSETFKKAPKAKFTPLKTQPYRPVSSTDHLKSVDMQAPVLTQPLKYEGEMAEREAAAQKEITRKKSMTAPIYNKGGYQYVGDMPPEIIKTLGRKV